MSHRRISSSPSSISTHALTEGDQSQPEPAVPVDAFQLTPSRRATRSGTRGVHDRIFQLTPSRRATHERMMDALIWIFQLTPSRRATGGVAAEPNRTSISTHALTEGDVNLLALTISVSISTHALTEGDNTRPSLPGTLILFQLTPSRRATPLCCTSVYFFQFQLTPSRRATGCCSCLFSVSGISTHALTEGDRRGQRSCFFLHISTHALTEGDSPGR